MEEQKQSKRERPNFPPPLRADQMLQRKNVVKGNAAPRALQSLKSANSFTLPTAAGNLQAEKIIQKLDVGEEISAWKVREHRVIRGLPVREFARLRRDEVVEESPTLPLPPPSPPEWADLIYHPSERSAGGEPGMAWHQSLQ